MGQMQNKNDGMGTNAKGDAAWNPSDLKDRVTGANFQEPHSVNPAYAKGGTGKKENPGRPV